MYGDDTGGGSYLDAVLTAIESMGLTNCANSLKETVASPDISILLMIARSS